MSRLLACAFAIPLAVSACTPGYVNTEGLGPSASEAEIRSHYAGKSILQASKYGVAIDTEGYFASGGTYRRVRLDIPKFSIGGRDTHLSFGTAMLLIARVNYYVDGGKVSSREGGSLSLVIHIQPDGSVVSDLMGDGNYLQPPPRPGFQNERRFNSLRREAGMRSAPTNP